MLNDLDFYIYDCEVFWKDWIFLFYHPMDDTWQGFTHRNPEALIDFIENEDPLLGGFNNKYYDRFILKACLARWTQERVKTLSDWLILPNENGDRNIGWQNQALSLESVHEPKQFDLMDDMYSGLSLKAIEGHLGMDIRESTVDFNLRRALTDAELEETIEYCKHDVLATWELCKKRESYLQTKINIGQMAGITPAVALGMTNAKLTAAYLKANRKEYTDEREYKFPENLKMEYIPEDVIRFYERIHDLSIPDNELFKSKMNFNLDDAKVTLGYGGIHAAIPNYSFVQEDYHLKGKDNIVQVEDEEGAAQ